MSGKKLRTDGIMNDLGSSNFFAPRPVADERADHHDDVPAAEVTQLPRRPVASSRDSSLASTADSSGDSAPASTPDSNRASTTDSTPDSDSASTLASRTDSSNASTRASRPAIKQASAIARKQASPKASTQSDSLARALASSGDLVDAIYRVVKRPGKEVSYVRLTEREKSELNTLVSELDREHSYTVTGTEIIRIAICNLLADYAEHGTESLLMRVIVDLKD